jgi:hypothetical protein
VEGAEGKSVFEVAVIWGSGSNLFAYEFFSVFSCHDHIHPIVCSGNTLKKWKNCKNNLTKAKD